MKRLFPFVLAASICAVTACQGPSVTQVKPGVYKIVCTDSGGMSSTDADAKALQKEAIAEGNTFAGSQGKIAIPIFAAEQHFVEASINTVEGAPGLNDQANGANWVAFNYFFGVVPKNDPKAQVPMRLVREVAQDRPDSANLGGYTVFYDAQPVP
jgi:hypothetical protein